MRKAWKEEEKKKKKKEKKGDAYSHGTSPTIIQSPSLSS